MAGCLTSELTAGSAVRMQPSSAADRYLVSRRQFGEASDAAARQEEKNKRSDKADGLNTHTHRVVCVCVCVL